MKQTICLLTVMAITILNQSVLAQESLTEKGIKNFRFLHKQKSNTGIPVIKEATIYDVSVKDETLRLLNREEIDAILKDGHSYLSPVYEDGYIKEIVLKKLPVGNYKQIASGQELLFSKSNFLNLLGGRVPEFSMKDMNGVEYNSETLKGKVIVFHFWFIASVQSKKNLPELMKLAEKYKNNKDVVFLALNNLDDDESIRKYMIENNFDANIVTRNECMEFAKSIGVMIQPINFIINKDETISVYLEKYDSPAETVSAKLNELIKANFTN